MQVTVDFPCENSRHQFEALVGVNVILIAAEDACPLVVLHRQEALLIAPRDEQAETEQGSRLEGHHRILRLLNIVVVSEVCPFVLLFGVLFARFFPLHLMLFSPLVPAVLLLPPGKLLSFTVRRLAMARNAGDQPSPRKSPDALAISESAQEADLRGLRSGAGAAPSPSATVGDVLTLGLAHRRTRNKLHLIDRLGGPKLYILLHGIALWPAVFCAPQPLTAAAVGVGHSHIALLRQVPHRPQSWHRCQVLRCHIVAAAGAC
mmetsp:Transcript_120821/g.301484  ORF Transcript_120821/g.301484 Transcript_120821/m.301484 type:complete len:262 (-) Transcript_120821:532-1317(-)